MPIVAKFDQGSTNLGRSPNLWNKCRWTEMDDDSNIGYKVWDDFLGFITPGGWTLTQYNSTGTLTEQGIERGVVYLDSAGATSDDGCQMQYGEHATLGLFTPAAGSTIFFETRVALGDTPATAQVFIGLSIGDTSLLNGGANSSTNHIGFESLATTSLKFYCEKAGTRSATGGSATACHTWVDYGVMTSTAIPYNDADWVKLGFKVNGLDNVQIFVDGVEKTALQINTGSTTTPVVALTPTFCVATETSTDPILAVDWVACAKQYTQA